VALLGLGLIGCSLGLALRRRGIRVVGWNRTARAARLAARRGAVSALAASPAEAVRGAGLVVLGVPPAAMPRVLAALRPALAARTVVTDVGSVKSPVLRMAHRNLPVPARFVGGHPMAGSERSGPAAARADLFRERTVVLTPEAATDGRALRAVARLWRLAGARVVRMPAARHDRLAAVVSHHPHLAAFALAAALGEPGVAGLVAGSFLDATRVAASPAGLWADILQSNLPALRAAVRAQRRREDLLLRALGGSPGGAERALAAAGRRRRGLLPGGTGPVKP